MSVDIGTLITKDIDLKDGIAYITNTKTKVYRIVIWYQQGMTPEEIADEYPHLTLASVYAALAYYHANKEEIETQIQAEDEFIEKAIALKKLGSL